MRIAIFTALLLLLAVSLSSHSIAGAAPPTADGCTFSQGVTNCTSFQTRQETRQRTVVSGCLAGPTGVPGRRTTVFEDAILVTTTTTTKAHGIEGPVFDTQTTEMTEIISSRELSSVCEPI